MISKLIVFAVLLVSFSAEADVPADVRELAAIEKKANSNKERVLLRALYEIKRFHHKAIKKNGKNKHLNKLYKLLVTILRKENRAVAKKALHSIFFFWPDDYLRNTHLYVATFWRVKHHRARLVMIKALIEHGAAYRDQQARVMAFMLLHHEPDIQKLAVKYFGKNNLAKLSRNLKKSVAKFKQKNPGVKISFNPRPTPFVSMLSKHGEITFFPYSKKFSRNTVRSAILKIDKKYHFPPITNKEWNVLEKLPKTTGRVFNALNRYSPGSAKYVQIIYDIWTGKVIDPDIFPMVQHDLKHGASVEEAAKWVRTVDPDGNKWPIRVRYDSDYQTPYGLIIDKTCFKGKSQQYRRKLIDKIEKYMVHLFAQSRMCLKMFRFPEITDLVPVIRRTYLRCTVEKDATASTRIRLYFGRTSGYAKKHYINIAFHKDRFSSGSVFPRMLSSINQFSEVMLHEVLHNLASNVSSHREYAGKDFNPRERFNDRVYLIPAICFPKSDDGIHYYKGYALAAHTSLGNGVIKKYIKITNSLPHDIDFCVKALTRRNKKWEKRDKAYLGPQMAAIPYKRSAAQYICRKIKKKMKRIEYIANLHYSLYSYSFFQGNYLAKENKLRKKLNKIFGQSGEVRKFHTLVAKIAKTSVKAFSPQNDLDKVRKELKKVRTEYIKESRSFCKRIMSGRIAPKHPYRKFCSKNPITSFYKEVEKTINMLTREDQFFKVVPPN